jgi:geranylgeranyl pyrophosphate synthase
VSGEKIPLCLLKNIAGFGLSLGILYQIVDNCHDNDAGVKMPPERVDRVIDICRSNLAMLPSSRYRQTLFSLADSLDREVPK